MKVSNTYLIKKLLDVYPEAHCALDHKNPLELLVATILSAQCTDERVNKVTPALFAKFPTAKDYANAELSTLEHFIRSTNFFKNKAKSLKGMGQRLIEKHGGEVPKSMEDLVELPGVGRKTANVVLGNAFGISSGIVVDTHVMRLSQRLGLSKQKTPEKIERDLLKIVPKEHWVQFSHWLITHGRAICNARSPRCEACFLRIKCPKIGVTTAKKRA